MHRKPHTPPGLIGAKKASWQQEAEYLQRQIDEGKRLHSPAGRVFPHLTHGTTAVIARRPAQYADETQCRESIIPNLRAKDG